MSRFQPNEVQGPVVCLLGASLDTGNQGVSALAASLVRLVLEAQSEARIRFLVGRRSRDPFTFFVSGRPLKVEVVNYRLSPRARFHEHLFSILLLALLYRFIPAAGFRRRLVGANPFLGALMQADFIGDIRGGDSFSDIYGLRKLVLGSLPSVVVLLLGRPLTVLPQTLGPYRSRVARGIARYILSRAEQIYARDLQSIDVARDILGPVYDELLLKGSSAPGPARPARNVRGAGGRAAPPQGSEGSKVERDVSARSGVPGVGSWLGQQPDEKKTLRFCPDVAFALEAVCPKDPKIAPALPPTPTGPLVGLNVNGLLYNGGYTRDNMFRLRCDYKKLVHELVLQFMNHTEAHVLLVPHNYAPAGDVNSDDAACRELVEGVPKAYHHRVHLVTEEYNQHEVKGIIGGCTFFLGARMHACIAALSQQVPTVGMAYSRKFAGVFESVGAGDMVVDLRVLDNGEILSVIARQFAAAAERKKDLRERIESARALLRQTFAELLEGTGTGSGVDARVPPAREEALTSSSGPGRTVPAAASERGT